MRRNTPQAVKVASLAQAAASTVTTLDGFGIRTERNHDSTQMYLSGELDLANVNLVDETLSTVQLDHGAVVLDLEELTFMDSSGVEVFLEAAQRAKVIGGKFRIVNSSRLQRVFDMTGTTFLLQQGIG